MKTLKRTMQSINAVMIAGAIIVPSVASAEEVNVGVLVPLTGELGEFGKIVSGAIEIGVKQVNAAGGTSCGMLRTVIADTGGSPEKAIREATNMIENDDAVAILGPTSGPMVALVDLA
jgi:branched-chain amino acid transport system substrate-binding protein/neutral amino acid transport system substrate-binding protein